MANLTHLASFTLTIARLYLTPGGQKRLTWTRSMSMPSTRLRLRRGVCGHSGGSGLTQFVKFVTINTDLLFEGGSFFILEADVEIKRS